MKPIAVDMRPLLLPESEDIARSVLTDTDRVCIQIWDPESRAWAWPKDVPLGPRPDFWEMYNGRYLSSDELARRGVVDDGLPDWAPPKPAAST